MVAGLLVGALLPRWRAQALIAFAARCALIGATLIARAMSAPRLPLAIAAIAAVLFVGSALLRRRDAGPPLRWQRVIGFALAMAASAGGGLLIACRSAHPLPAATEPFK